VDTMKYQMTTRTVEQTIYCCPACKHETSNRMKMEEHILYEHEYADIKKEVNFKGNVATFKTEDQANQFLAIRMFEWRINILPEDSYKLLDFKWKGPGTYREIQKQEEGHNIFGGFDHYISWISDTR
jgi:hypothetical protein